MRIPPLLLALALAAPVVAPVATEAQDLAGPRPLVVAEDPVLRLGDLFEGAGPRAAQPVGAAPAPGRRLVIEATQLAALARAHGIPWRPLSAGERVVVERPGQAVPRDDIALALRGELLRHGLDPEAEIELGPLAPTMVPPGVPPRLLVEAAGLDPTTGRFGATLLVMAEGMPALRQRVAGRAVPTLPVVLATRRLALGEVVGPGDVRPARLRAERVRAGAAERVDQVIGQQLRRPMATEAPFLRADLAAPALVEKNALVTLVVEAPGLALTAQGRALDAGARGGLVPVMNLASRTIVEGQVIAPGRVRVAIGAAPLRMGGE